ncbi:MAG: type II secretion system F family protein, partial [Mariprofundales bacterium]|nr:type II secretion system F family protein [Mariprofundales bacterium]
AIDSAGRRQRGEIEAESERAVRKELRNRKMIARAVTIVTPTKQQSESGSSQYRTALNSDEITTLLQQLATLTEAGMPLVDALGSIADGMEGVKGRRSVAAMRQHIVEGGALAEAMTNQKIDSVVCNMVAAGEETGELEAVAARLAELLERRQQMRQDLLSATLYPAIILGFGVVVMLFLLAFVVPQIVSVFERTGGDLPLITKVMIAISAFLRSNGLPLLAAAAALPLLIGWLMRRSAIKQRWDLLLLNLPGVSALMAKIETARYCRTLGMLLNGGVPALAAMKIATESISSLPLRNITEQAREVMREGGSLAESLGQGGYIPHLALRMIAVGEQSGRLDKMLIKVADTYEQEASRNLKRMLTILEPMLVLLMALGVGSLAMAILLPIVEMNQLVH